MQEALGMLKNLTPVAKPVTKQITLGVCIGHALLQCLYPFKLHRILESKDQNLQVTSHGKARLAARDDSE